MGERGEERLVRATHLRLAAANLALQRFEQLGIRRGAAGFAQELGELGDARVRVGGRLGLRRGCTPRTRTRGAWWPSPPRARHRTRGSARDLARAPGVCPRGGPPRRNTLSRARRARASAHFSVSVVRFRGARGFGRLFEAEGGAAGSARAPPASPAFDRHSARARASHLDTRTHDPATLSNVGRATSRGAREPRLGLTEAGAPEPTAPPWPHTPRRTPRPRAPRRGASTNHRALRPVLVVSRGHLARSPRRRHPGRAMRPRAGRLVRVLRVRLFASTRGGWLPSDWRRRRPVPGVRHGQHRPFTARGADRGRHDGGGVAMHGPAPVRRRVRGDLLPASRPGPEHSWRRLAADAAPGPASAPAHSSRASSIAPSPPATHSPP